MNVSSRFHRAFVRGAFVPLICTLIISPSAAAKDNSKKKPGPAASSIDDYIKRVGTVGSEQPATSGSLWVSSGPLADTSADYKAHLPGDLIVVNLVDTFSAATSGENATSRQFSTQSAITALLGKVGPSNAMQNLLAANSATALDGKGASTMSSNLQLNLSGRVVQVMPNGVMIIEAARDFTVGNDRQTVVLRGLVRPGDIASDNSILSTSITSLELGIKGKGAVADATARPSLLMRALLKVLSF